MASSEQGPPGRGRDARYVLDTGAILQGLNLPPAACVTTPGVLEEIDRRGATGRRSEYLLAAGLGVHAPTAESRDRVAAAAEASGARGRLSRTDVEVLALALDVPGVLVTDDYTVQDVAQRLGLRWDAATTRGIRGTVAWSARCSGCGRSAPSAREGDTCRVCGALVVLKRARKSSPR